MGLVETRTTDDSKTDDAIVCQSVLFVDSNPALSHALALHFDAILAGSCQGVKLNGDSLIETLCDWKPDVLIVDPGQLTLGPEQDLCDFSSNIRRACGDIRLIGYCARMDDVMLRAVIEAGFVGCVGKDNDLEQLDIALRAVCGGAIYIDPTYAQFFHATIGSTPFDDPILSDREREVIVRTARGQQAKHIAHALSISSKTVDTYKSRALQKLGLSSRAELVDHAIAQGWLG
ncbi:LuxR C-terminal-related transcriptional regulator [Tropicibacter naphthalenivorans]|uniref:Nitrogen regulation protein C n=1 Tax=Tropicibacter naphthalenivorans TaxID=441103 RepID=A0A0P1GEN6_9RHOB|nr:response regulator transcription factor [Tropicibacter naphthalenivorans]CUH80069.1 Nitrogen regulation protein C [Tropicibacter naphthalenivorans]SMC84258.1 two component transcriptional regulator, LuxR family [Tropicibacter naphthalenivorans]